MRQINSKIIIAVVIHIVVSLIVIVGDQEVGRIIAFIFIPGLVANFVGIVFMLTNKPELGAKIFQFSSIIFIPIGLIGMSGAKDILDALAIEEFNNQKN